MIEIKVEDGAVMGALNRLIRASDDLTPAMRQIADILLAAADRAFVEESDPATGTPWAPLKESTQRRMIGGKPRGPGPILQVSGELAKIQRDYGRDFAAAGTNRKYASTHQFGAKKGQYGATRRGSPIPWGDIPPRPFLGIGDDDKTEILDVINRHLQRAAG